MIGISESRDVFYRYDAFISYRHEEFDAEVAETLHRQLEEYSVPNELRKFGISKKITRVFRDYEELHSSSSLTDNIIEALQQSRFLIVICSKRTPKSEWVTWEIEYFKSLERDDKILALLIDGNPDQSFPKPLKRLRRFALAQDGKRIVIEENCEPFAPNIIASSKRKSLSLLKHNEKLRFIAPILGCAYDDLVVRHQKALKKKKIKISAVTGSILIILLVVSLAIWQRWSLYNRSLAASEVIDNLSNIYNRYDLLLVIYDNTLQDEVIMQKQHLQAPALANISMPNLVKRNSEQRAIELKSAVKDYPIRWESSSAKNLYQGKDDSMDSFLAQLRVLENTWDNIINAFYSASRNTNNYEDIKLTQDLVRNNIEGYFNNSELAFIRGKTILNNLKFDEMVKSAQSNNPSIKSMGGILSELINKEDKSIKKGASIIEKNQRNLNEVNAMEVKQQEIVEKEQQRVEEKSTILEQKQQQLDEDIEKISKIEDLLTIKDSDTWNQVAAKARSLRDLGRFEDAVKAYDKYESLFAGTDPTAKGFADTARLFTMNQKELNLAGGIYIYTFSEGSSGAAAGLQLSDVIVKYDGKYTDYNETLSSAISKVPEGRNAELQFLRKDGSEKFQLRLITVPSGKLGVGLMRL